LPTSRRRAYTGPNTAGQSINSRDDKQNTTTQEEIRAMKKFVLGALYALCIVSFPAAAQGTLNSYQTVDIKAPIWDVWDAVKDFDGLHTWHPMFSDDELKSGANDEIGAVRTMTVRDGPSFDEELLSFDPVDRKFSYRVIDPAPLPIADYVSTFQVVEGRRGYATILWRSSYRNNSEGKMKDEEVIAFIDGAYRSGLDNLKATLEAR
jgi:mxaD protein